MKKRMWGLIALNIFTLCLLFGTKHEYEQAIETLENMNATQYEMLKESYKQIEELRAERQTESIQKKEVRFTNYYQGDSEGSTATTGSGLTTDDFQINEKGWYTYNGKVVVACSTYECLRSDWGGCATVNTMSDVPNGYDVYNYFDEIQIEIDGIIYDAIILDSCLASYWDEEFQRYDIFIADEEFAFGKIKGFIY